VKPVRKTMKAALVMQIFKAFNEPILSINEPVTKSPIE